MRIAVYADLSVQAYANEHAELAGNAWRTGTGILPDNPSNKPGKGPGLTRSLAFATLGDTY
jgi:hypothetical protein